MRVTGSSTSRKLSAPPQPLANPRVLKGMAATAAMLPLLACVPQGAKALALAAPGALAAAAGGVIGLQTLGRMIDIDLGEITQTVGAIVGASAAAAFSAMATALARNDSLMGSLAEGWGCGACVGVGMAVAMGVLAGHRGVLQEVHRPTLMGTLGTGVFIAGLNCLALKQQA